MSTVKWDSRWSDPEDYCVLPDVTELNGIHVGERVYVFADDPEGMYFEGDEGQVIGITEMPRSGERYLLVHFEGMDPQDVSPYIVEVIVG